MKLTRVIRQKKHCERMSAPELAIEETVFDFDARPIERANGRGQTVGKQVLVQITHG
jgi:hypothetical protein